MINAIHFNCQKEVLPMNPSKISTPRSFSVSISSITHQRQTGDC